VVSAFGDPPKPDSPEDTQLKTKRKARGWVWTGLIAIAAIAALAWGFWPRPIAVETAAAARAPLRVTVEEEGRTRVRDRYVVSAPVAGFLRRLPWKTGDPVRAGDVVAQIEPPRATPLDPRTREESEARVGVATASLRAAEQRARSAAEQVRAAQVDLRYRKQELERAETLLKSDDIPRNAYDSALFEFRRAEANLRTAEQQAAGARVEIETARAEVEAARAALTDVTRPRDASPSAPMVVVRAPAGGRVLNVVRKSEGAVAQGEALIEIADARALEVEVEVLSADAVRMGPGTRVLLTRWGGDHPLEARVRIVEPTGFTKVSALGVEEQRVRVIADITAPEDQWRRLGDGYRVEAGFILWESEDALQVPASALFRRGEDWAVFVVENGVARRRVIKTGRRTGLAVQIESGISEGERVITHPDETIEDGKAVQPGRAG
jgi:HlyD family secretion protein